MATSKTRNWQYDPPVKTAATVLLLILAVLLTLIYFQFRGDFTPTTRLSLLSDRSGLVMEQGSKVTFNGVQIGRVTQIDEETVDGTPKARLQLEVEPRYVGLLPANVVTDIRASTVFGAKYVAFTSPPDPLGRIDPARDIDVSGVTTEFNTLFETLTDISSKIDPVKLNATLSATADALTGLGGDLGRSLVAGNDALGQLNPRLPTLRYDLQQLAGAADTYSDAGDDLIPFLDNLAVTSRTITEQQGNLDAALMSAVGFARTGTDIVTRSEPYLVRGISDLVPTSQLLDEYSPMIFCTIRNYHDVAPVVAQSTGGNGFSIDFLIELIGAENPYVFPDNLPRVNASGGPGGRPGCWQPVTRDFWPAPYLVMDTGASIAPYNHFQLGQPLLTEYVWGRQGGANTINP